MLLALSGRSGDMREILAGIDTGDERCRLAFDTYIHRLAAAVAAMAAAMGGIDARVHRRDWREFGAGPNATCAAIGFLGVEIDGRGDGTDRRDRVISPPESTVVVMVLSAREDIELATQVRARLAAGL
jgi:acetate kinase